MILHVGEEKFEFTFKGILNVEAMAVKRKIGLDYRPWMDAIDNFNAEAVTALVWIVKKRQEPTLKFEEVEFPVGSIDIDFSSDEEREEAEGKAAPKEEESPTENSSQTSTQGSLPIITT